MCNGYSADLQFFEHGDTLTGFRPLRFGAVYRSYLFRKATSRQCTDSGVEYLEA
jgi:hypothetical protein